MPYLAQDTVGRRESWQVPCVSPGQPGIQQPHSHLHSTGTSHTPTLAALVLRQVFLYCLSDVPGLSPGADRPHVHDSSFISPSFHTLLPDILVKQREHNVFCCCSYHHQAPLPISLMAVLVQQDLSDVGKCSGISREPGVKMEDLVVACLAAFGMTEYSAVWYRELVVLALG